MSSPAPPAPDAPYTLADIAALTGARLVAPSAGAAGPPPTVRHWVYDTRLLLEASQSVFLALRSERRDGHAYCAEAYARGVRVLWVAAEQGGAPEAWQLVSAQGVLPALQRLAAAHRRRYGYPVVGITGSNGKTVVKEWLATLLAGTPHRVVRSPGSFNSQLGVALALLELRAHHTVALIECGISQRGEMARLAELVQPTLGVLTHMGDAHAEGFASEGEKLQEKLLLFAGAERVVGTADDPAVAPALTRTLGPRWLSVGRTGQALQLSAVEWDGQAWQLTLTHAGATHHTRLSHAGTAAVENLLAALGAGLALGVSLPALLAGVAQLEAVSLRSEMITDNPELTVLADAYTADAASVRQALALLEQARQHPRRRVILTDLEHQGPQAAELQRELAELAVARFGAEAVELVGPMGLALGPQLGARAWADTEQLLAAFDYSRYVGATVLLKGARRYRLERLIPLLSRHPGATVFRVNLDALVHNLRAIRRRLPAGTEVVCMLKAAAYGAGAWQLAQRLDREGVQAYAVAYPAEGIDLRQHGISTPVMVLNADAGALDDCLRHRLEPAVWSAELLQAYGRAAERWAAGGGAQGQAPLHIEFDTGMARLGFGVDEVPQIVELLRRHPQLRVRSAFTHLAAADEASADGFTRVQLERFAQALGPLRAALPGLAAHALNTAGILRHSAAAAALGLNWVRLGVGLYGVSPLAELQHELREVGSLITRISQVHRYAAGTPVGYGQAQVLTRPSRIATLPVGYADGIPRRLGAGPAGPGRLAVLVQGQWAPVVGRICMDMLMVDVTEVEPEPQAGDEVGIIGRQGAAEQSVTAVAAAAETIAYEILAGLSPRIRRVYVSE